MFNNKTFKKIIIFYFSTIALSYLFFGIIVFRKNTSFYMQKNIIENKYYLFTLILFFITIITFIAFIKRLEAEKTKLKERKLEINNTRSIFNNKNERILKEISDIKEINEALRIEKIYFTTVFNSIPDNIMITDRDNKIIYANDKFKKFTSNYSDNILKSSFKFDYKKHIETNNIMFNNNINSFELIEDNIIYRKKMINNLQYLLTFGEDKSNVKIVSDKLVETIVELKKAESEVDLINNNLNSLLNFIF
ncbi:MAG: PAS domain-containing protein, partial [Bacillota bacterium]|nr:PAS domain-containing protein [Bacillota bacterium]